MKKLPQTITYYIKYLQYLVKLFVYKIHHGRKPKLSKKTIKHLPKYIFAHANVLSAIAISILVFSLIIPPFIKYLKTPKPISLKRAKLSSPYLYAAESKDLKIYIGKKTDNTPIVALQSNNTNLVSFTLTNTNKNLKKPKKKGNKLVFESVRNNTDLTYETLTNGIKEEIVLNSPSPGNSFTFDMEIHGANPRMMTTEHFQHVFFDKDNKYLFHFLKPFAYDSNGNQTDKVTLQLQKTKQDANFKAIITVDKNWLNDPNTIYPVYIDPTVVHDTTSEFSTGTFNRNLDTGQGSFPSIETFYQELPADEHTVGLWHMNEGSDNTCTGGEDICDTSGNDNDGTFNGTAAFNGSGKLGGDSMRTDGDSDYAEAIDHASLDQLSQASFEAWIYPDTTHSGGILRKETSYLFRTDSTNALLCRFYLDAAWSTATYSSLTTTPGQWNHIACTWDGSTVRYYVNGIEDSTTIAASGTMADNANTLRIGINYISSYFDGQIDELRISNIARTPEEIKASASRRPYSTYTSPVIDLTDDVLSWNSLSWDEWGVSTGDGETVYSSTDLVAQWNFNETSGITANNDAEGTSCGGTPADCDGTLSGFDSTASQDADPDSSWTANNRRWGAGALQFDNIDSYVNIGDIATVDSATALSACAWVKHRTTSDDDHIISKIDNVNWDGFMFLRDETGQETSRTDIYKIWIGDNADADVAYIESTTNSGNNYDWNHVCFTYTANAASGLRLYVNGIEDPFSPASTVGISSIDSGSYNLVIGRYDPTGDNYFSGTMDVPQLYSRALPAHEIMSLYNASNIELQTRVGTDNSPNDGSWDEWSPLTSETQILSEDSHLTDNLTSYWKMDESSGNRSDSWGINTLTDNATVTSLTGIINNTADFTAANFEFLEKTDNSSLSTGDIDFSVSAWVNLDSTGAHRMIATKQDSASVREYILYYHWTGTEGTFCFIIYNSSGTASGTRCYNGGSEPVTGTWYHIVSVHDSVNNTVQTYVNDASTTAVATTDVPADTTANFRIGAYQTGETAFMDGQIDEVGFWKKALSSSNVTALYNSGYPQRPDNTDHLNLQASGGINNSTDSNIKIEGAGSEKITIGKSLVDGNTVALWHLDETNGDNGDDDIFDETANNHDGEFVGTNIATAVVDGISGKARDFNGTDDKITITDSTDFTFGTGDFSIELWVNPDDINEDYEGLVSTYNGSSGFIITTSYGTDGSIAWWNPTQGWWDTNISFDLDKWQHLAFTRNGSTIYLYVNGIQVGSSGSRTGSIDGTDLSLGWWHDNYTYFNGSIDEVRITKGSARTAEEIAEAYRMGRDHYINRTISSTDLSDDTKLPFYIAADRPGAYLSATIGESAYANYQPDTNTVGLWHLDEGTDNACNAGNDDACDSSGNNNHGDESGSPPIVQGKMGKARKFDGSSNYIEVPYNSSLNPTSAITMEGWIKTSDSDRGDILARFDNSANFFGYALNIGTAGGVGVPSCWVGDPDPVDTGAAYLNGTYTVNNNQWHYIVCAYDGTTAKLYIDGVLNISEARDNGLNETSDELDIGRFAYSSGGASTFDGLIDEVRISNIARTASEIRQAYEIGLRTHPITIDFSASADSGNLIASATDLSFTIDATAYGLENKGSSLYVGDTLIVREIIDDTEYIAQATASAVTTATGAVTIPGWHTGSTFPSGGYTANASIFKWQEEYWDISDITLSDHVNAVTNLTLRVTDGNEGRTIWLDDLRSGGDYLTTKGGSTLTSSTGNQYFQYRALISSWDEAISATMSAVTLDYTLNTAPNTPSLDLPTDTATNQSLTPALKTTTTDPDSDYMNYKIEICEDSGMSVNCNTYNQVSSQTGWSGQDADSNNAYASGTQATYTLQSALAVNDTFYWRSYAIDYDGSNTWSSTQGAPYSFSTTTAPTAPTTPYAEGTTNPTGIIDLTPELSAIHNDGDGDSADYYQILVNTQVGFDGTEMWDSTKQSMTTTANGIRSPDISYAGSALSYGGVTYYWKIKFWDVLGAEGVYSATQNLTTNAAPNTPSLDSPTNTASNQIWYTLLKTTATDTESDYLRYKIDLCENVSMTTNCNTYTQTGGDQTGWSGQNAQSNTAYTSGTQATYTLQSPLASSTTYYWRSYAIDPAGTNSWGSTQGTPYSFTTTPNPVKPTSCTISSASDDSQIVINWIDNATNETNFDLDRSLNGAAYSDLATKDPDANTHTDTDISQGNTYRYMLRAYRTEGATTRYSITCYTATASIESGSFNFEGLKLEGLNLN